jgi:hypothetical protein
VIADNCSDGKIYFNFPGTTTTSLLGLMDDETSFTEFVITAAQWKLHVLRLVVAAAGRHAALLMTMMMMMMMSTSLEKCRSNEFFFFAAI